MDTPKFSLALDWKAFKVHLPDLEKWLKSNAGDEYAGNSADSSRLILWFKQEPSEQIKTTIQQHWDGLSDGIENEKISKYQKMVKAEAAARQAVAYQGWDQLLPAERKIVSNTPLSDADREALLTKYPQV